MLLSMQTGCTVRQGMSKRQQLLVFAGIQSWRAKGYALLAAHISQEPAGFKHMWTHPLPPRAVHLCYSC